MACLAFGARLMHLRKQQRTQRPYEAPSSALPSRKFILRHVVPEHPECTPGSKKGRAQLAVVLLLSIAINTGVLISRGGYISTWEGSDQYR